MEGVIVNVTKPHVCSVCGKGFARRSTLNIHIRTHTGEKRFCCDLCGKMFSGSTALKRHTERHNKIRAYKCNTCEKSFIVEHELKEHQKIHSEMADILLKKYPCDMCNKVFRYPSQLKVHKRRHTGEKPAQCTQCDAKFICRASLSVHVKRVHDKEKLCKCLLCGKGFFDGHELYRHSAVHSTLKPFKCQKCGKCFSLERHLTRHQKTDCIKLMAQMEEKKARTETGEKEKSVKPVTSWERKPAKSGTQGKRKTLKFRAQGKQMLVCAEYKMVKKSYLCGICDRNFALELSKDMHVKLVHGNGGSSDNPQTQDT